MASNTYSYSTGTPILKYNKGKIASPVTIDSSTVTADTNGRKVVPAGSFIGSTTTGKTILSDHVKGKVVTDVTCEGILLYDVDVTAGDMPGALLTHGVVYASALPVAVTSAVSGAIPHISFEN